MARHLGQTWRVLGAALRPLSDVRAGGGPAASHPRPSAADGHPDPGTAAARSVEDALRHRRRLYGRLAAVYVGGSGALGLVTLPIPAPGSDKTAIVGLCTVALVLSAAIWFAPWEKWPQWASLGIMPPALGLIALGNSFAGVDSHTYSVFFIVAFVWLGLAQPPRVSVAIAPLAAVAYVLPLVHGGSTILAGLSSAAITIPICVLVGEGIAWGVRRQDEIEHALRRERDQAEHLRELDEMKDAFLSAVSHELRTPITICRGHLEVFEDDADEAAIRAVRDTLVDELALMGRLVDDLGTLARIDDRALLRPEDLQAGDFLLGVAGKAETLLGSRLRIDLSAPGAMVRADPQRLTQALLNLLRNAAEHGKGQGPVCLSAARELTAWCFMVTDEGGGLPPGEEEIIFEQFNTGSSRTGRTGLGLAIVRGIARAHGGEAGVINRPGRGATFWIRIPR